MDDTIIRSGNLIVTPTVHEIHLAQAYLRMAEEGTLDIVFHQSIPSLRDFLAEYMSVGRRIVSGCFRERDGQPPEFCGMGWAFGTTQMDKFFKCELGEVFFKRQSKKTDNLQFGKMLLEMFFTSHKIDVAFGVTPEPNKLALRYAQKLGFDLSNPIPDYCTWQGRLVPGIISHMSREQWFERNQPTSSLRRT